MNGLRIGNKLISVSIITIVNQLRKETGYKYFKDMLPKQKDVMVTCPCHKDGRESHPSLSIHSDITDNEYGVCHCFTCGFSGTLDKLVNYCFNQSGNFGKEWLVERFGDIFIEHDEYLPEITFEKIQPRYLDERMLNAYQYRHPYMYERHLTDEILDKFHVGYDKVTNCITFPVWDINNNLVSITRRSVSGKHFQLEENRDKPVYLLNYIKQEHITTVYVVESQINALTLWSWGYPAVALLGTGSKTQYEILKHSGVRSFILCFDGDEAGDKGIIRFKKNMLNNVFITVKNIPRGKDVNDITKEEFDELYES